jgi:hypothetical protein
VLDEADRAIGPPILHELHEKMGPRPYSVDLTELWRDLGVGLHGDHVVFDDRAPFAPLRRAITERASL